MEENTTVEVETENTETETDVSYLTPDERLSISSDRLIQSIIRGDDASKERRRILFGQLVPKVFRNENFVIYNTYFNFKDKGITPTEDFLKMYLLRNKHNLLDNADVIDLNAYKDLDDDPVVGYVSAVVKQYKRLIQIEPLTLDDFKLEIEVYKLEYSNAEMNKTYSRAKQILYDGLQIGRRNFQGYEDSVAFVKKNIAGIEATLDHSTGEGFIDSRIYALAPRETTKPELIGDFDMLDELNKSLGGYYTTYFYNIMAPTKGGKSKWCARAVHSILMHHNNVSIWPHEGGTDAWWAQMRAIHYEYLYIRNKQDAAVPISQDNILKDDYPNDEVKALEEASAIDLFNNTSYGNMHIIDRPFKVETFIDEVETSRQLNDSKAICIDYLQLIGWDSKNLSKPQAIGKAYQDFLAYCKKKKVMGISPSQFTQEYINELSRDKDGRGKETRTAGGESAEIIRTPDVNIGLYASVDDLARKRMTILSVPSRFAPPFKPIEIHADLGTCVFASLPKV